MQELARQLAIQMDQNNELLAQLQRLEEDSLAMQKASADKQSALRQALAVADAARADANEAKRRLAVAQEVSVKLADEVKDARGEAGALARQVEALEAWAGDAKAEIARLADGKAAAEAQVRGLLLPVCCCCIAIDCPSRNEPSLQAAAHLPLDAHCHLVSMVSFNSHPFPRMIALAG